MIEVVDPTGIFSGFVEVGVEEHRKHIRENI